MTTQRCPDPRTRPVLTVYGAQYEQDLRLQLFVLAALIGAVLSTALAADRKQDQFSAVRDRGFDTMDQCVATISAAAEAAFAPPTAETQRIPR